jgi:hypothetical protein
MSKNKTIIAESSKKLSKKDITAYLADISENLEISSNGCIHSVLALNNLLRQPNAEKLFDEASKKQAQEIWIKIKSTGLQLGDPPLLFGLPKAEEVSK